MAALVPISLVELWGHGYKTFQGQVVAVRIDNHTLCSLGSASCEWPELPLPLNCSSLGEFPMLANWSCEADDDNYCMGSSCYLPAPPQACLQDTMIQVFAIEC